MPFPGLKFGLLSGTTLGKRTYNGRSRSETKYRSSHRCEPTQSNALDQPSMNGIGWHITQIRLTPQFVPESLTMKP